MKYEIRSWIGITSGEAQIIDILDDINEAKERLERLEENSKKQGRDSGYYFARKHECKGCPDCK